MKIGTALGYPFDDMNAGRKLPAGLMISMLPIFSWAVNGYYADLIRNIYDRKSEPLPAWDQFGEYWMLGAKLWIGNLPYAIPTLLMAIALIFVGVNADPDAVILGYQPPPLLSMDVAIPLSCIGLVLSLFSGLLWTAAFVRFSIGQRTVRELWQFAENTDFLIKNLAQFIGVSVVSGVYGFAVGLLLGVPLGFCGLSPNNYATIGNAVFSFAFNALIGFFPALFSMHLLGQLAQNTIPRPEYVELWASRSQDG